MSLIMPIISILTILLLGVMIFQFRSQRIATEALLDDHLVRTRLYQDADESTTFILSRTLHNVSAGHPDANLQSDSFALRVVRELVKRKLPKKKWLELQTNERLVHELYLLLRDQPSSLK